jgi:hypothetical protein
MKKIPKYILYIVFLFIFRQVTAFPTDSIPGLIQKAVKAGNAAELSRYFNNVIELSILDNSNIYSKIQAERILSNFFMSNQPIDFKILSERESRNSKIIVGKMKTEKSEFRISYILSEIGGTTLVNKFQIEKID